MNVTILGCGDSAGVPRMTGDWGTCAPENPKNYRTRMSVALHVDDQIWLIDTSPDLRLQFLREKISRCDGVLFTHAHADHILGIDELRLMYFKNRTQIPIYGDAATLHALQACFGYMIATPTPPISPSTTPRLLTPHVITEPFAWVGGRRVIPFRQDHGTIHSVGYRMGSFAYTTDAVKLDEHAFQVLEGVHTWFVDCIDYLPKPSHSHLEQTLSWIDRVRPERAILIHMGRMLDYDTLCAQLPSGIEPAYDGMTINIPGDGF